MLPTITLHIQQKAAELESTAKAAGFPYFADYLRFAEIVTGMIAIDKLKLDAQPSAKI